MASSFTFKFHTVQQQQHFFSLFLCKSPSTLNLYSYHSFCRFFTSSSPKPTPLFAVKDIHASLSTRTTTDHETPTKNSRTRKRNPSGDSSLRTKYDKASRNGVGLVIEGNSEKRFTKDKKTRKNPGSRKRIETVSGDSLLGIKSSKTKDREVVNGKLAKKSSDISAQDSNVRVGEKRIEKGSKKVKNDPAELKFRVELDMCSKRGDVMGAIQLYDRAQREGIQLGQYHYTVFLYLCSSAAVGVVKPAKSGNDIRTSDALGMSKSSNSGGDKMLDGLDSNSSNGFADLDIKNDSNQGHDGQSDTRGIQLSEDLKKYALTKGFEIYEKMCTDNITMNEASLTAVGRMAMSMGDGDMAFDAVRKMKELGINPRLRSYTPALSTFCNNGDIDKAFAVEKHMLENGVYPEEPELEALLRVSVENGKGDEVYYLLHKLRTCVRKVSPSTADVIMKWFESKEAARVGKRKLDKRLIKETIESKGGGWHGLGWLGKGRWNISRTVVGDDALCKCCGGKLAMIDLDPTETDNFAESVASIAIKRERNLSFQKFQKWLDYYGPFEVVIDAANVGLFSQRKFKPSRVNVVVNGIRQRLPSRKWPLIVLHNRRVNGEKMDQPVNRAYVDKWRNADALYATPTGSNDDWYWLYAAIKFKSLIVTNDEMRDHTFQLLGNDFFPRWKERHQVRFSFSEAGPAFHMPPPFSVVIQESEKGDWHIPVSSNNDNEAERSWLCITRSNSHVTQQNSTASGKDLQPLDRKKGQVKAASKNLGKIKSTLVNKENSRNSDKPKQKIYKRLKNILSASVSPNHQTVLAEINSAEKLGNCVIDFQI